MLCDLNIRVFHTIVSIIILNIHDQIKEYFINHNIMTRFISKHNIIAYTVVDYVQIQIIYILSEGSEYMLRMTVTEKSKINIIYLNHV